MLNFTYHIPTKVVFGKDTETKAGALVKEYGGTRVLIHYGGTSALKSGLLDRVKASLDEAGLFHVELGGVVPNPHLGKVREGIALAQEHQVDFLLAVGGGSVIDSAKAIAYGLADPDLDVWDLYEHTKTPTACMPVGTILTIAAAGSEMSNSSVITDESTGRKRSTQSELCRPKFAIMNPALTMTLPAYQTASGCTDILMHSMERYFHGGDGSNLTDAMAEGLMRTVMHYAEVLRDDPTNYEARAEVMWAGALSHNGLTGCGSDGGDWQTHMLEHELGGMFDVAHGAGLAAMYPSWAQYVMEEALHRFVKFAVQVMDVNPAGLSQKEIALAGVEAMKAFYRRIGMPTNLTELGLSVTDQQIQAMAASCKLARGPQRLGSVKRLLEEDMMAIYKMARG